MGRGRRMQGPGDPGEEATPDARSVSARCLQCGRQRGQQERTSQEGRAQVRRRLGEDQDADMGENPVVRVDPLLEGSDQGGSKEPDAHGDSEASRAAWRHLLVVCWRVSVIQEALCLCPQR